MQENKFCAIGAKHRHQAIDDGTFQRAFNIAPMVQNIIVVLFYQHFVLRSRFLNIYCSKSFKLIPKLVNAVLKVCEVYGLVRLES